MADAFSKEKRSEIMRAVKNKDSKIEVALGKALWHAGFRYRKNVSNYFGKPDIVLKKYNTAIFIDSCFWHGCKKHCRMPLSRREYWTKKIQRNKQRDSEVNRRYRAMGWNVVRVWEHELSRNNFEKLIERVIIAIKTGIVGY